MMALDPQEEFEADSVALIPMRRRHVKQVMRIESLVYPRPWSATLFYQEITRRADRVYLAAKLGADVVGYGGLMTSGLEAHITTIAVDPACQRHHIGTRLMLGLIDAALDRGGVSISLEVRRSNLGAQAMYERFGFKPVGIRRGYYIETAEDAIVMLVENIDSAEYAELMAIMRRIASGEAPA